MGRRKSNQLVTNEVVIGRDRQLDLDMAAEITASWGAFI